MTVSIIIAVKTWGRNLEECVNKCRQLDYPGFEILIMPDEYAQGLSPKGLPAGQAGTVPTRFIPTGPVSPAKKRDIAIGYARGEVLAFIDDDAYPRRDWLKNAMRNFQDSEVAAVGGPAITPIEDNPRQRASGLVYAQALVSGKYAYRYLPKQRQEVDDYPSCNFLVRKSVMQELGGFKTNFWPGEDTKLCLEITKRLGKKIIYAPEVIVYHHRRPLFLAHLKQVASYALHRGYFVKKYPQTSLKAAYFIPSALALFIFGLGIPVLFSGYLRQIYFLGLSSYLLLVAIFSFNRELSLIPLVFAGIIMTHLTYGIYFLKGLFSGRLAEEKDKI